MKTSIDSAVEWSDENLKKPSAGERALAFARRLRSPLLILLILGTVAVVFLAWFYRYEVKQDGRAGTVRVNRFTGEVARLQGNEITIVRPPENYPPTQLKTWPPVTIGTLQTNATVSTRWRAGSINFRLTIDPVSQKIKTAHGKYGYQYWNLLFEDSDGFEVFKHRVMLYEMTDLTGISGEPEALELKSSLPLSYFDYQRIASVNVGWGGWRE